MPRESLDLAVAVPAAIPGLGVRPVRTAAQGRQYPANGRASAPRRPAHRSLTAAAWHAGRGRRPVSVIRVARPRAPIETSGSRLYPNSGRRLVTR